ncbi:hypothetical protein A8B83_14450 [Rhodobacteraceae bacterium EhC02]|nr:hypothetical protein A8B83_14450 [Rhodobacteraceae bacterium EhC02]
MCNLLRVRWLAPAKQDSCNKDIEQETPARSAAMRKSTKEFWGNQMRYLDLPEVHLIEWHDNGQHCQVSRLEAR